eukprot:m.1030840 g.1030840  ORF g.1030840 m.1030840 type:complete len:118 (+) comp24119_c0_seq43:1335-1688(+)
MMQTSAERISDGIDTVASVQPLLAVDNNMLSGVRIRFQLARGGRTKVLRAVLAMETWNLHNFHRLRYGKLAIVPHVLFESVVIVQSVDGKSAHNFQWLIPGVHNCDFPCSARTIGSF